MPSRLIFSQTEIFSVCVTGTAPNSCGRARRQQNECKNIASLVNFYLQFSPDAKCLQFFQSHSLGGPKNRSNCCLIERHPAPLQTLCVEPILFTCRKHDWSIALIVPLHFAKNLSFAGQGTIPKRDSPVWSVLFAIKRRFVAKRPRSAAVKATTQRGESPRQVRVTRPVVESNCGGESRPWRATGSELPVPNTRSHGAPAVNSIRWDATGERAP